MFNFFRKKDPIVKKVEPKEIQIEDFENTDRLMEAFKEETGIEFDQKKSIFQNKVVNFAKNNGVESIAQCIKIMQSRNSELKEKLIDVLTTNETYFYREIVQIQQMAKAVKESGKSVRILSAPCSTGEEPYTIAMILLDAGVELSQFEIVAIDINKFAVDFASKGCFRGKSLRKLQEDVKQKYFYQKENNIYCVDEAIKDRITFKTVNIFNSEFKMLGKFDYIFSRNMLIYFDYETKLKVKELLLSMLKDKEVGIYFGHADLF
ncbi:MAG: CheR family methyltransferase [Campylobacterota bacterium]